MNIYQDRLGNSTSEGEKAWHYHNWARCLLEEGLLKKALEIAELARETAQKAEDKVWELNSQIIVAQSLRKFRLDRFSKMIRTYTIFSEADEN